MRSLLLLLLLRMPTGSLLKVDGCKGGSVFFNKPEHLNLTCDRNTTKRLLTEENGMVKIVGLEKGDSTCFSLSSLELELKDECPGPITLCPGQGEEVSVPCDYPGAFDKYDKYFCKEEGKFQCKEILSKTMSIKFRTNKDYGIYWCGFNHSSNIVLIQKVSIQNVPVENQTSEVGRSLTFKCNYSGSSGVKRICRGPLQYCQQMLNTSRPTNGRYHMEDATNNHTLTITIKSLIEQDRQGPFWCYSKNSDGTFNIHSKLNLTFGTGTTGRDSPKDGLSLPVSIVMGVAAGVLMVMLVSLGTWKCLSSRNPREGQKLGEVNIYEEIQRRPLEPNSVSSIYVTATHPSTALHYSTVAFKANSDECCVVVTPKDAEYPVLKAAPRPPDEASPTGPATRSSSSLSEEQLANLTQQD
ncbi:uncharacterized protein LOC115556719 isoform X1 [Gadus morhua]|uniref:uncharacterized protein LOC115556719 isoform X1 n=1 Tax=Gadus morhua TaxID=8049 RepID=UPI0011B8308F|nr:uncharacterized protein LOC115556719 isoform X1 [Gadus morhua]XP_030229827.1 uncharacterized protein LOC115556719 isoform X1 [Gadus morhua]XP_030229828.1 uncharacterized protein LOC115556719 isoform X1 [Gadus morhua]XP_030229829.1 uncharacterized protein LOC115556719 isoform X1 [Gadus morhua]XP_030229830.1 uncharacterized protein LOC115556719 isoform X1 [Gadus morhua]